MKESDDILPADIQLTTVCFRSLFLTQLPQTSQIEIKVAKIQNEIPNKQGKQISETTAHIPHLNTEQEMYVKKVPIHR